MGKFSKSRLYEASRNSSEIISGMRSIPNFARVFEQEFSAYVAVVFSFQTGMRGERKLLERGIKNGEGGGEGRGKEGRGVGGGGVGRRRIKFPKSRKPGL